MKEAVLTPEEVHTGQEYNIPTGLNNEIAEDFETLLGHYLNDFDIEGVIADKRLGEVIRARRSVIPSIGKDRASNLLERGIQQKQEGSLGESYQSFLTLFKARSSLSIGVRHLVVKNLADVAVQSFDSAVEVEEKLRWVRRAYNWFSLLPRYSYNKEPPQSKLHSATQLGKVKYRHALLTENPKEKLQLLKDGYDAIETARHVASENLAWQFVFNSALNLVSRAAYFTSDKGIKHEWGQRWYQAASESVRCVNDMTGPSHIKKQHLTSKAHAAACLSDLETEEEQKKAFLCEAYVSISQALDPRNGQEDPIYDIRRFVFAASISTQIGNLSKDLTEKKQWFTASYQFNQKAAEMATTCSNRQQAARSYFFAANIALKIARLSEESHIWFERSRDDRDKYLHLREEQTLGEKVGLTFAPKKIPDKLLKLDDLINNINEGRSVRWAGISWNEIRSLLEKLAAEIDVPVGLIGQSELKRPAKFLGGHSLNGLYAYAQRHPERSGQDTSGFVKQRAKIDQPTLEDVISYITSNERVEWNRIPPELIQSMLLRVAEKMDKSAFLLTQLDLSKPLDWLKGGNLKGLSVYAGKHSAKERKDPMS